MKRISHQQIQSLRRKILRFYRLHGRNLPFRKTTDPYKITVAEIMLQQTQVDRVVPKYKAWIKKWSNWQKLSKTSNKQLLRMWSGLGYNRRALNLGKLAKTVVNNFNGKLAANPKTLQTLPGIGPYTANAILIFAYNKPLVTIDTNIRRVILYELGLPASTSMKNVEKLAWQLLPEKRSRDWHNALMDYSRLVLPNKIKRLPALTKQSKFEGSVRQIRGEIVRQLTTKPFITIKQITRSLKRTKQDVFKAVKTLEKDGMVKLDKSRITLT
ncbi:Fe-S cluster assembly protein HesB [Patescibacteria group bacterium]